MVTVKVGDDPEWEYTYVNTARFHSPDSLLHEMNRKGEEGWELVTSGATTFWFKRRKRNL